MLTPGMNFLQLDRLRFAVTNLCFEAVRQEGMALKFVPTRFRTEALRMKAGR